MTDQALALATVDLLALPVAMPDAAAAAVAAAVAAAPGALTPGALSAAAVRGLGFLQSHCGLEPGRVFTRPTPLGAVAARRPRESLAELLAAGGFPPLEPEPLPEAEVEAGQGGGDERAAADPVTDPGCDVLTLFASDEASQASKESMRRPATPPPQQGVTPGAARGALPEPCRVWVEGRTA